MSGNKVLNVFVSEQASERTHYSNISIKDIQDIVKDKKDILLTLGRKEQLAIQVNSINLIVIVEIDIVGDIYTAQVVNILPAHRLIVV